MISITYMCFALLDLGDNDYASFIRYWNDMAAKSHQVVGNRAVAVKLLLETCPRDCANIILNDASDRGWDGCAFSEANLCSKKVYPGFQHRCTTSKAWVPRIKTSVESFRMHLLRTRNVHINAPIHFRKKVDKNEMDAGSERAAAVYEIGQEAIREVPFSPVTLESKVSLFSIRLTVMSETI